MESDNDTQAVTLHLVHDDDGWHVSQQGRSQQCVSLADLMDILAKELNQDPVPAMHC